LSRALYTPVVRADLAIARVLPTAALVSQSDDEDVFQVGACRLTCRYWVRGGDFVSKQILGCATAVASGELRSADPTSVEEEVYHTQSIIGAVGPEEAVDAVVATLAARFGGVLVSASEAVMVVPTA